MEKTSILRVAMSGIIWVAACIQVSAQSQIDLMQKYLPIATYQIRPGIIMFVEFDNQGQACQMTLERNEAVSSNDGKRDTFSAQLADQLVDELAPVAVRGQPLSRYLNPDSYVAGGVFLLKQDFTNVSVEKIGNTSDDSTESIRTLRILWTKRSCSRGSKSGSIK